METPGPADAAPTSRGLVSGERVFGRFVLVRQLGRGGMGVVWLARDETLDAEVALKFLPDAVRWDAAALAALRRETRRSRELTHPHIVRVHDIHEDAGSAAIAMEYLAGGSLHQVRATRTPPVFTCAEIAAWLPGLCAALDHAHAQGVVHRDLKPANLLVAADGAVKISDFGIAQPLFETALRISQWAPSGTLAYMSPQHQFGEPADQADDIYALGATLYELLTGKPPFYTGNLAAQIERRPPDSLAARRQQLGVESEPVPAAWEEGIVACLAKRSEDRPADAAALAARLTTPTDTVTFGAGSTRKFVIHYMTNRFGRFRVKRPVLLGLLALALGVATWVYRPWIANDTVPRVTAPFASDATRALAAWNLDGDGQDASGRGLHLTGSRAVPTADRYGRIDRALHFNGNSVLSAENFPAAEWSDTQPFTVSLWVYPQSSAAMNSTLISLRPTQQGEHYWSLVLGEGRPMFFSGTMQEDDPDQVAGNGTLPADRWTHLTAVHDGRQLQLFVNGRLEASRPVSESRSARAPTRATLAVGFADRLDSQRFVGRLDDLRLWRRALTAAEIARLTDPAPSPAYRLTRGLYADKEDLAAVAVREFGPGASLADWKDLSRWHVDDARGWVEEIGLTVEGASAYVQREGSRLSEAPRHYFISRFDGRKPDYYLVHDELGGMSLALGSWYGGRMPALIARPFSAPTTVPLSATADGSIVHGFSPGELTETLAVTWRREFVRNPAGPAVRAELRWRDGRIMLAEYAPSNDGSCSLTLGDAAKPQLARQTGASYDLLGFTVVVRAGRLHFRAVSVRGADPIFMESVALSDLNLADLVELRLSDVDAAELTVER